MGLWHPAVKVNSICAGNYRGSSVWLSTQQVNYWSYILHSSNTWEKMGIWWRSADYVNTLDGSVHTIQKNKEVSIVASKNTGLEKNADKTKYMVMSRDKKAGRSHRIKIDYTSFERVEQFKYFGTSLTNQNPIQEEIKSILKSENACYHSVQNFLSSSLLPKKY